jgi:integrase/recombinase XerC
MRTPSTNQKSLRSLVSRVRAPVLAEAFERWLEHLDVRRESSRHTLDGYGRDVAQLLAFVVARAGDGASPAQIDRDTLRAWLRDLASTHGASTRARKIAAARSFFRLLCQRGELAANPALEILLPKVVRPLPRFLHDEDAAAVIEACNPGTNAAATKLRDRAVLELFYGAGLRVSELCALNLTDVRARPSRIRVASRWRVRAAPLGSRASAALRAYLARREELQSARREQDARALFLTCRGTRLAPRRVQALVRQYGALGAGRPDLHPHALRHSFAATLLNGGADISVVHTLLGNANLATTERYRAIAVGQLVAVHRAAHPLGRTLSPARAGQLQPTKL